MESWACLGLSSLPRCLGTTLGYTSPSFLSCREVGLLDLSGSKVSVFQGQEMKVTSLLSPSARNWPCHFWVLLVGVVTNSTNSEGVGNRNSTSHWSRVKEYVPFINVST